MKTFLNEIPISNCVLIFGAGLTGKKIYNIIKENRSDIKVLGFIDTFKTGNFLSEKIYSPFDISNFLDQEGLYIIIATVENDTIIELKNKPFLNKFNILVPIELENNVYNQNDLLEIDKISLELKFGKEIFNLVINSRIQKDYSLIKEYYYNNIFSKKTQYFSGPDFSKDDIIIDGGMFDGTEAMHFANMANKGMVFSFDPWGGKMISDTDKFQSFENLKIVSKALWNKTTKVYFSSNAPQGHEAGAFISNTQDGDFEIIDSICIDDFVINEKLKKIDFIKMDIEGSEIEALLGAENSIKRFKPRLAICVYHDPKHFFQIPNLILSFNPSYKIGFEHYTDNINESVMYFF
jgi:FkbM family methyltransferase